MRVPIVVATAFFLASAAIVAAPPVPQPHGPIVGPTLRITSPAGGEKWYHGSHHPITWKAPAGFTGTVELVLLRKGAPLGVIAHGVAASKGRYGWFCSNYEGGVAPPGGGYQVMIRAVRKGIGPLAPLPAPSTSPGTFDLYLLVVTAPNGNESWTLGSSHAVTWTQKNMTGTVDVSLWRDTAYVAHIARGVPAGGGAFTWTVGSVAPGPPPPGAVTPGPGYRVCVKSADAAYAGSDCSDQSFTVQ
jgi:hypothetical protein